MSILRLAADEVVAEVDAERGGRIGRLDVDGLSLP